MKNRVLSVDLFGAALRFDWCVAPVCIVTSSDRRTCRCGNGDCCGAHHNRYVSESIITICMFPTSQVVTGFSSSVWSRLDELSGLGLVASESGFLNC